jgi:hypothetical protein
MTEKKVIGFGVTTEEFKLLAQAAKRMGFSRWDANGVCRMFRALAGEMAKEEKKSFSVIAEVKA